MKESIIEFLKRQRKIHELYVPPEGVLKQAGYFHVLPNRNWPWSQINPWIEENIGRDNCMVISGWLWFTKEEDATMFLLRWA